MLVAVSVLPWYRRPLVIAVVVVLAWGSTFAAIKVGMRSSPPILFGGLRAFFGGLIMVVVALMAGAKPMLRKNFRAYVLLTLFNVAGFYGLQMVAVSMLPSGMSAVLIYLQPVLTAALAVPILHEQLNIGGIVGTLLAFCGIVVVSLDAMDGAVSGLGVILALLAALAWSLGTIVFKYEAERLNPWWAVAIPFVVGGLMLTGYGAATEGTHITWNGDFVWGLLWSTVIGTSFAWGLWFLLVDEVGAARAAVNIFFVPLVAILIGALLLHESLDVTLLLGGTLVAIGVYLVNRRARTTESTDAAESARLGR